MLLSLQETGRRCSAANVSLQVHYLVAKIKRPNIKNDFSVSTLDIVSKETQDVCNG